MQIRLPILGKRSVFMSHFVGHEHIILLAGKKSMICNEKRGGTTTESRISCEERVSVCKSLWLTLCVTVSERSGRRKPECFASFSLHSSLQSLVALCSFFSRHLVVSTSTPFCSPSVGSEWEASEESSSLWETLFCDDSQCVCFFFFNHQNTVTATAPVWSSLLSLAHSLSFSFFPLSYTHSHYFSSNTHTDNKRELHASSGLDSHNNSLSTVQLLEWRERGEKIAVRDWTQLESPDCDSISNLSLSLTPSLLPNVSNKKQKQQQTFGSVSTSHFASSHMSWSIAHCCFQPLNLLLDPLFSACCWSQCCF